jgi:DNA-directed RNA polymerase subunit beta
MSEQGLTYCVSLKAKLRLSTNPTETQRILECYRAVMFEGNIPYMTLMAALLLTAQNGLLYHTAPCSRSRIFRISSSKRHEVAFHRVIPMKGSWVEFTTDINSAHLHILTEERNFRYNNTQSTWLLN